MCLTQDACDQAAVRRRGPPQNGVGNVSVIPGHKPSQPVPSKDIRAGEKYRNYLPSGPPHEG